MTTLKEERQAAAVRRLSKALDARRAADAEVRAATAEARDAEVSVNRIAALAGVSRAQIYTWLRSASPDSGPPAAHSKRATPKRDTGY